MGLGPANLVSIAFPLPAGVAPAAPVAPPEPPFFRDLNLDQVVRALVGKQSEYDIKRYFYSALTSKEVVQYRQEVARDLESEELAHRVNEFAALMRSTRAFLNAIGKLGSRHYKQAWFLDAAEHYCDAVGGLVAALTDLPVRSQGLCALRDHLGTYVASPPFIGLREGAARLRALLSRISYTTYIKNGRVTVNRYEGETDYSAVIEGVFAKFRQGQVKDYRSTFRDFRDANHVQGWVLEQLAKLYPDVFDELDRYCTGNVNFVDGTVALFDTEARFYRSYLELVSNLKATGLSFCYPEMSGPREGEHVKDGFDLALAVALAAKGSQVVCNDIDLSPGQRIIVVTGPNQGGKTTFARMFGQLHYLASLGLPVPGRSAQLLLPDNVFAHFEREELLHDLRGKLEDELVRVRSILDQATANSVVVMNESFSSTSLSDNRLIGTRILEKLTEKGVLCAYVTFVDELSRLNSSVVSYVSEVVRDDPSKRTYRVLRCPADGRAYARTLAKKYGLTYELLRERMAMA